MHHTVVIRNVLLHPGEARVVRGVEHARALGTLEGETYQLMQYARLLSLFVRTHEVGPLVMLERTGATLERRTHRRHGYLAKSTGSATQRSVSCMYLACILMCPVQDIRKIHHDTS